jgi:colanic acid biosynthesis glycosyl transferase WcaI
VSRALRILLVNQYYPPDASATARVCADVVDSLISAGHEVTVLCGRPSYGVRKRQQWRALAREDHGPYECERVGSISFDRSSLPRRMVNYASYLSFSALRATTRPRADVVIAGSDPPLAILVGLIAARGGPVVYNIKDLHPDAAVAAGLLRPGPLANAWARLHSAALRRASLVICLSEAMAARVRGKGVARERIAVVPDGGPPPTGDAESRVVEELRGDASFVALHAGNLGGVGAWDTLVAAAHLLDSEERLVFVGDGAKAQDLSTRGLRVLPYRPADQLASVMAAGDLQIVTLRPGMEGLVFPSKLYTILAYGRPVLAVVPKRSEVADLVRRWRCGMVVDPGDARDLAHKLRWAHRHPEALSAMTERAREAGRRYERRRCFTDLVQLVEAAAEGHSPNGAVRGQAALGAGERIP